MTSAAHKAATANLFIVYDFYDVINKIIQENNLMEEQLRNCDIFGFPTDHSNVKFLAPLGRPGWKVTCGAGRENVTVLATCNATERALDPLILFAGKNFQSTWRGKAAWPNTMYGISENGWMTIQIFYGWFVEFCKLVTKGPALLIYDGHLSHVSLSLIKKTIEENIIIVKFPPM